MKYTEWQPIGVCDNGPVNQVKVKIFSKKELAIISAPGVDRDNWKQYPEIVEIIHHRAKDVAKMSTLTQGMKNPIVTDIRLVGTVLKYGKTPSLNRESTEGRVQFFRVEFEDQPVPSRKFSWKTTVGTFLILLLCLAIFFSFLFIEKTVVKTTIRSCSDPSATNYLQDIERMRNSIQKYANTQGRSIYACNQSSSSISQNEILLLSCASQVKRHFGSQVFTSNLMQANTCIRRICAGKEASLESYCQQFKNQR